MQVGYVIRSKDFPSRILEAPKGWYGPVEEIKVTKQ
jgi:hypothetical protein